MAKSEQVDPLLATLRDLIPDATEVIAEFAKLAAHVDEIEARAEQAERERDEARARLRYTCQALVEAAGADGPLSAEDAVKRAAGQLDSLRARAAKLEKVVEAATRWRAADLDPDDMHEGRPLLDALADACDALEDSPVGVAATAKDAPARAAPDALPPDAEIGKAHTITESITGYMAGATRRRARYAGRGRWEVIPGGYALWHGEKGSVRRWCRVSPEETDSHEADELRRAMLSRRPATGTTRREPPETAREEGSTGAVACKTCPQRPGPGNAEACGATRGFPFQAGDDCGCRCHADPPPDYLTRAELVAAVRSAAAHVGGPPSRALDALADALEKP